nr:endoglucanase region ORF [Pseudomonas sp.]
MPLYVEEGYTHMLRKKLRNGELDVIIVRCRLWSRMWLPSRSTTNLLWC